MDTVEVVDGTVVVVAASAAEGTAAAADDTPRPTGRPLTRLRVVFISFTRIRPCPFPVSHLPYTQVTSNDSIRR